MLKAFLRIAYRCEQLARVEGASLYRAAPFRALCVVVLCGPARQMAFRSCSPPCPGVRGRVAATLGATLAASHTLVDSSAKSGTMC